jgi:hypothetical protein
MERVFIRHPALEAQESEMAFADTGAEGTACGKTRERREEEKRLERKRKEDGWREMRKERR